ncbi:MAG: hypothetical protein ABI561_23465, partial [Bradyrhizobium sp.]
MSKAAVGKQVLNVADDRDEDAVVAAVPAVGGSTRHALDAEGYAATIENIRAEISRKASTTPTKRSRSAPAPNRAKAVKASDKKEAPSAPLPVFAAPAVVEVVAATPERTSGALALVAAVALAAVAAYFSVTGMAEIFPGAPVAV